MEVARNRLIRGREEIEIRTADKVGTRFPSGVLALGSNSFHEFADSPVFLVDWTRTGVIILFYALAV